MAAALAQGSTADIVIAIVVMVILVVGVNVLVWRPLVAWSEKFRNETSSAADRPRSVALAVPAPVAFPGLLARPARPGGARP